MAKPINIKEAKEMAQKHKMYLGDILDAYDLRDPAHETEIFNQFLESQDNPDKLWDLYHKTHGESDVSKQIITRLERLIDKKLESTENEDKLWAMEKEVPIESEAHAKILKKILLSNPSTQTGQKVRDEIWELRSCLSYYAYIDNLAIKVICEDEVEEAKLKVA